MGIRVGYEPVSSIGALGLESGRNAYQKWLAQMRQQQAEMQQRAQLQAQQIAADKERYNFQAKIALDERERQIADKNKDAEADRQWRADEAQKQRDWLSEQKRNEWAREDADAEGELAGLAGTWDVSLNPGQDNIPIQSTPSGPGIPDLNNNKMQQAFAADMDAETQGIQNIPYATDDPKAETSNAGSPTARPRSQYTDEQKREFDKLNAEAHRIMTSDLKPKSKLKALKQLDDRRKMIKPLPVWYDKGQQNTEPEFKEIDGVMMYNDGSGRWRPYQPKPTPQPKPDKPVFTQRDYREALEKAREQLFAITGEEPTEIQVQNKARQMLAQELELRQQFDTGAVADRSQQAKPAIPPEVNQQATQILAEIKDAMAKGDITRARQLKAQAQQFVQQVRGQ